MTSWSNCTLGALIEVKHGFAFLGKYFGHRGTHIVLTPGNFLERGGFRAKAQEKWYSGPIPETYVLRKGDILIAMTEQAEGLLGATAIVPTNDLYLHNQRLGLVQVLADGDPTFIYHLFNSPAVRQQIRASASGAKVRHTSPSRIASVRVLVPVRSLQRRIAGILSAYEDLSENCERRIRLLEEMTRALYREWFVDFRYPGHEKVPIVESRLGRIPKNWTCAAFTDVADVLSGGTPKTDVSEFWDGTIPFFTPRDAPDCCYVRETEKHLSDIGLSHCASSLFSPDTLFITARGTVGKLALASRPMAMNQSCYALRSRAPYSRRFLYLLVMQQVEYLKKNTGGATFDTIVVDTLRRMQIVAPPGAIATQFSRLVDPFFDAILKLATQAENLRKTRDLLLPRLMSGQLSVGSSP